MISSLIYVHTFDTGGPSPRGANAHSRRSHPHSPAASPSMRGGRAAPVSSNPVLVAANRSLSSPVIPSRMWGSTGVGTSSSSSSSSSVARPEPPGFACRPASPSYMVPTQSSITKMRPSSPVRHLSPVASSRRDENSDPAGKRALRVRESIASFFLS